MELFSRKIGSGHPVVVLHGLFGMSDNWVSIAKALARHGFGVHLLDLRNHGRSPHTPSHTYNGMCEDILEYFNNENLTQASLIGHSMGGKNLRTYISTNCTAPAITRIKQMYRVTSNGVPIKSR